MKDFGCLARDRNLAGIFSMAIPFYVQTMVSVSVLKHRKKPSILLKLLQRLYPSERKYRNASSVAVLSRRSSKFSVFTFVPVNRFYLSQWTPNEIHHCKILVSNFTLSLSPTCRGICSSKVFGMSPFLTFRMTLKVT